MTQLIILIAFLLSFRCLMQPLVPFVVLLSCSVSFIPPEKLLSAWTPTVDLGLSSGASAGEVCVALQHHSPGNMSGRGRQCL